MSNKLTLRFRFVVLTVFALMAALGLPLRTQADGFPLPVQNGGTWGSSPASVIADLQKALTDSGFLDAVKVAGDLADGIAHGQVPAVDDLAKTVEGDVKRRIATSVSQASDATHLLSSLDVSALQKLFAQLQSTLNTSQEFAFSIPGGRFVVRRSQLDLSMCAVIAGAGGTRVTLGMSNGAQLGGNPAERFLNPTREPLLFADLALGYSNLQVRRKLLAPPVHGPDPAVSIQAATYFKIRDDWVQLRFAGNDPQALSLKAQFVVGVRLGASAEIQAEIEGQVLLDVEVNPTQVASLMLHVTDILRNGLGNSPPASLQAAPAAVAPVLKQVFSYLKSVKDGGEPLGAISLSIAVDGGVGVGIWDTGINLASVGAQLQISVPLEALISLEGDVLAANLEAGLTNSRQLVSLFEAMSEGRLDAQELARQRDQLGATALKFGKSLFNGYGNYLRDIRVSQQMGVYALGDIGQVASQTIPVLVTTVDIPVGQIFVDGIQGLPRYVQGVTETAQAMAWFAETAISAALRAPQPISLGKLITPPANPGQYVQRPRGNPPTPPTPAQWKAMAAGLLDGVTFSLQFGSIRIEGGSLGNLVRLAADASEVTASVLTGAIVSAANANETPLLEALRAAPGQLRDDALDLLIFNLQNLIVSIQPSIAGSGTVGAEATVGLGASLGFNAQLKTSLLLLALGNTNYSEPHGTLLAGFDLPITVSASGGVALSEGVEFTAEGGVTAGMSLANLTLKEWGQGLPAPAGLQIAGFEVIDFVGTNRQDGLLVGNGWIVLPMGGLVRADSFTVNAAGHVVEGKWSGVVELGPLGTATIAGGRITDQGLVGSMNLSLGQSFLLTDFRLQSNGLLFGTAKGDLRIGPIDFANVSLSLTPDGSFDGTARSQIAGAVADSKVRIRLQGQPTAHVSSLANIGGSYVNLDFDLTNAGGTGIGTALIFGQQVVFNILIYPDGSLQGSTQSVLLTPWGVNLDSNLTLDSNGIHGSGRGRILGSEFTSADLRVNSFGRLTGHFSGTLYVDGQSLALSNLEIRFDSLVGRTRLGVAGHPAVDMELTVGRNGVVGRFVNNLSLFGAGSSRAWARLGSPIEVFGQMDDDFLSFLESALRDRLLAGVADAQAALRREQEALAKHNSDLDAIVRSLGPLMEKIRDEKKAARAGAEKVVDDAEDDLRKAAADLEAAIAAVSRVSGDLSAKLADANRKFSLADANLAAAKSALRIINDQISALDRGYKALDPVAQFFASAGYQIARAALIVARDADIQTMAVADKVFREIDAARQDILKQLQNAEALIEDQRVKEFLKREAEQAADQARKDLDLVIAIATDPTLDPRYVAASLARDGLKEVIRDSEIIVARAAKVVSDVAGLIALINQHAEAFLVKIQRTTFRSTLADLNRGNVELIVEALVANQPRPFVISYNFKGGNNTYYLATAASELAPTLYPPAAWTVSAWTDDATSGLTPSRTLWAYRFNATDMAQVASVPVPGLTGTQPAVSGRFSVQGFTSVFTGDQNALTAGDDGSAILAANFLWGDNPGTITFEGLTPGRTYRATFLSVGWDEPPITRTVTFGSDTNTVVVSQNAYGNNQGIRIEHTFTATADTHVVSITPSGVETFHLYALALSAEGSAALSFDDWKLSQFGADAGNPAMAADDADPDGDQIPNLVEYALRTDPQVANPGSLKVPVPVTVPGVAQARQLILPYQASARDVVYHLRHSTDLQTWTEAYRLDPSTGDASQAEGVNGTADILNQNLSVIITAPDLLAGPSFWSLTIEKR